MRTAKAAESLLCAALLLGAPAFAAPPLAGGAVRSKEWVIRKDPPEEEFTGDVSYRGAGLEFRSDWALWDKTADLWKARGHVQGRRAWPEGVLRLWGDGARWNAGPKTGTLSAKDAVRYVWDGADGGPGAPAWTSKGTSDSAEWNETGQRLTLVGRVRLWARQEGPVPQTLRARSGVALVEAGERTVKLKDGPPVVELDLPAYLGAVRADRVMAASTGSLKAHGQVTGWLYPKEGAR